MRDLHITLAPQGTLIAQSNQLMLFPAVSPECRLMMEDEEKFCWGFISGREFIMKCLHRIKGGLRFSSTKKALYSQMKPVDCRSWSIFSKYRNLFYDVDLGINDLGMFGCNIWFKLFFHINFSVNLLKAAVILTLTVISVFYGLSLV